MSDWGPISQRDRDNPLVMAAIRSGKSREQLAEKLLRPCRVKIADEAWLHFPRFDLATLRVSETLVREWDLKRRSYKREQLESWQNQVLEAVIGDALRIEVDLPDGRKAILEVIV